tara:strand:- start:154 stop:405 length:252 start_codon:yes stop_codon:yes gene_type:complete
MSLTDAQLAKIDGLKAGDSIAFLIRHREIRKDLMDDLSDATGVARKSCETFPEFTKRLRKKHDMKHKTLRKLVKKHTKRYNAS